ncbi:MAG: bifunctional alpha,alpha-trehalose-phosphate synthase (UDP-forming)/trehalose-phosphatase, partial [Acidobacteria bacterium]
MTQDRVIVVSNRLPLTLRRSGDSWRTDRSAGGLATALGPLLRRSGGVWIGWPGDTSGIDDAKRREVLARWAEEEHAIAVELPPQVARGFYEGYSNQTLWPAFHQFLTRIEFDPESWRAYVDANRRFRDAVLRHYRTGDLIWIHDYQLMLLPQLIREAQPEARIGFFLHIPFPPSDTLSVLPEREELLEGMLGSDFLAFHTHGYLQHFRASLLRVLGLESRIDRVAVDGRWVHFDARPIGIAPEEFTRLVERGRYAAQRLAELRQRFAGRRLILAVDRLDYTKGIPERLRAFRRLLESFPDLRGRVVLVQVAVPSRERIGSYKDLRREVDSLVGRVNGEFGTPDWTPIVYIRRSVPRPELVALYAASDVAWVAPLRDGLNLVAKEYVACQKGGDGALVLGEFAGAATEMGEAFLINPYDEERTIETLRAVLDLDAAERRERMAALYRRVARNNVFAWSERFIASIRSASDARLERPSGTPEPLPVEGLRQAFEAAPKRLLLLDYDGTLAPYARRPQDAVPPRGVLSLLERLARHPANCVALVSGRMRADLDAWFGAIPNLWLAAEHGAILRSPQERVWEAIRRNVPVDWKATVLPILEHFADRTPGSFIEEKEYALVWHYRMADPEFSEWLANELVANMEQMLAQTELRAVRGSKSVEVRL